MTITNVHYELTDLCNAGCPQCPRTDPDGCRSHDWIVGGACSLEQFRRYSPPDFLRQLRSAYFCGNFGDAAVVPELIDILRYAWEANPALRLELHTNAGPRTPAWWAEMADVATGHAFRVIAGIDGASQESNARYRVRTDFARIMANMRAFIGAGGVAEWRMLVFRHNEDEVEAAQRLARITGFAGFRTYPSNRFKGKPEFRYRYRGTEFVLEPPTAALTPKTPDRHRIPPGELKDSEAVIECVALQRSSAYISFEGYLLPCCYVGRRLYIYDHAVPGQGAQSIDRLFETFDIRRLNIETAGFTAARDAYDAFMAALEPYWAAQEPQVCKSVCGRKRPALEPAAAGG